MKETYEQDGFNITQDDYEASSVCNHCGAWMRICSGCLNPRKPAKYNLDAPWGSNNTQVRISICEDCYVKAINLVRAQFNLDPYTNS